MLQLRSLNTPNIGPTSLAMFFILAFSFSSFGQEETIYLKNPSFEGIPRAGTSNYGISAPGWDDCGRYLFSRETPPDIHDGGGIFRVNTKPQDGETYLGLVARKNETWESVSQLASAPMKEGNCYSISVHLARSATYVNKELSDILGEIEPQSDPLVLRLYGGLRPCEPRQVIAISKLIEHTDWREYTYEFEANSNLYSITLEAFYKTPVLTPYRGNLLIDNVSPITRVACPDEELVTNVEIPEPVKVRKPVKEEEPIVTLPEETKVPEPPVIIAEKPKREKYITQELNNKNITKGLTIKINKLFFAADTSAINKGSYSALNEVYDFLNENPDIRIEIGGHTNGIPTDEYCDHLSEQRAKAVATYLIRKGIKASRLEYRGYGKRKLIASDKTKEGRQKNQRVEIKIL